MMIRAITMVLVVASMGLLASAASAGALEAGCPDGLCSCDQNLDGDVQINELVGGVNNVLQGCDAESAACVEHPVVLTTSTRVSPTEDLMVAVDDEPVNLVFTQEDWDTADNFDDLPAEGTRGVTIPEGEDGLYYLHMNPLWAFAKLEGAATGDVAMLWALKLSVQIYVNEEVVAVTDDLVILSTATALAAGPYIAEFNHVANVIELLDEADVVSAKVQAQIVGADGVAAGPLISTLVTASLTLTKLGFVISSLEK